MKTVMKKQNKIINNKKITKIKTEKKVSKLISLDQPKVSATYIDKLSLVIHATDPDWLGLVNSELIGQIEHKNSFLIKGNPTKLYSSTYIILCPDTNGEIHGKSPHVLLQTTSKQADNPHLRIEYNPGKVFGTVSKNWSEEQVTAVVDHLDFFFQGISGKTFFELLGYAKVTRADIYREVYDRKPDDYLFQVKHTQGSQSVFGSNGDVQTVMFGKQTGNQTVIYNKAAEQGDMATNKIRIERRPRFKKTELHKLFELANPFERVRIVSLVCHNPPYGKEFWIAFQDACRLRGVSKAIAHQPKSRQPKLRKAVSQLPVQWWGLTEDEWKFQWDHAMIDGCFNLIKPPIGKLTLKDING